MSLIAEFAAEILTSLSIAAGQRATSAVRTPTLDRDLEEVCRAALHEAIAAAAPDVDESTRELLELVCLDFFAENGVPRWIVQPGLVRAGTSRSVSLDRWAGRFRSRLPQDETFSAVDVDPVAFAVAFSSALWEAMVSHSLARDSSLGPLVQQLRLAFIEQHVDVIAQHLSVQPAESAPSTGALGPASRRRTDALLAALSADRDEGPPYQEPLDAVGSVTGFLNSTARVHLLTGASGCGKSRLVQHVAAGMSGAADFQLHVADHWLAQDGPPAARLLRYASLPATDEPSLSVEAAVRGADRCSLIVIDGIRDAGQLTEVAQEVDALLREVVEPQLRFMLVVRTPPEVDVSAFPVLAASVYAPLRTTASYRLSRWSRGEAGRAWEASRRPGDPAFTALPAAVRELVRVPLHLRLLRAGGEIGWAQINAYDLIDRCVRAIAPSEDAIDELAQAAERERPDLVPRWLRSDVPPDSSPAALAPLLIRSPITDRVEFGHDVIREFALATVISRRMRDSRSVSVVTASFNAMAAQAVTSATARSVCQLTALALDRHTPATVTAVLTAPTVDARVTVPLLLALPDARFVTDGVLRQAAERAVREYDLDLTGSVLGHERTATALGTSFRPWLLRVLDRYGSQLWQPVRLAIDAHPAEAEPDRWLVPGESISGELAAFVARHWYLFSTGEDDRLENLLASRDWRVRAALADGARDKDAPFPSAVGQVLKRLCDDTDYKVRAATARALPAAQPPLGADLMERLLVDPNWHVRESVLHVLLAEPDTDLPARAARLMAADSTWAVPPRHVGVLLERLRLLVPAFGPASVGPVTEQSLFGLLRESRTGWTTLNADDRRRLADRGRQAGSWLVRREAEALDPERDRATDVPWDAPVLREAFRRLRGARTIQVALDLADLDEAVAVARAAARAGVDFVEVGDPLVKQHGVRAIERIKRDVPEVVVVAEMMSADWGREQVVLAAGAGADVVFLIGPASVASVAAAAEAGRRLGVPVMLDVPGTALSESWVRDMERAGVDAFAITTNIDIGVGTRRPLARVQAIRSWTRLPVAVSGGFGPSDRDVLTNADWDILIVGRSVTEGLDPELVAQQLVAAVRRPREEAW
ncbi:orotidine 5'-phosphate decarboxylase / HUMPS family protein [Micromonospora sp. NPDC048935]|uniref:orotidine 5'-phosphate decarboxylase / HUMPS family protein n=1 Tax=Micromonospora sp. NPDC048935 TaxID=3364262 RepID=UPI00371C8021